MWRFIFIVFSIFLGQHRLTAQEVVNPATNTTTKKIDKKIDIIPDLPNAGLLGYAPAGSTNDRKQVKPSSAGGVPPV